MIKRLTFLFLFFSTVSSLNSQNKERVFEGLEQNGNSIQINVNDGVYQIKYFTSQIVETSFIPKGDTFNPNSHATVLEPKKLIWF